MSNAVATYTVETIRLEPGAGIAIRTTIPMDQLPAFFGEAFSELAARVQQETGETAFAGPPFARYYSIDPAAVDVEAVFPLTVAVPGAGRVQSVTLAGGEAIQVLHVGPYDAMVPAYEAIQAWLTDNGKTAAEPPREVYLTDPGSEPDPANWRTLVIQPYR